MAKKVYEKPTCDVLQIAADIVTLSRFVTDGAAFDASSIWWSTNTFNGGNGQ